MPATPADLIRILERSKIDLNALGEYLKGSKEFSLTPSPVGHHQDQSAASAAASTEITANSHNHRHSFSKAVTNLFKKKKGKKGRNWERESSYGDTGSKQTSSKHSTAGSAASSPRPLPDWVKACPSKAHFECLLTLTDPARNNKELSVHELDELRQALHAVYHALSTDPNWNYTNCLALNSAGAKHREFVLALAKACFSKKRSDVLDNTGRDKMLDDFDQETERQLNAYDEQINVLSYLDEGETSPIGIMQKLNKQGQLSTDEQAQFDEIQDQLQMMAVLFDSAQDAPNEESAKTEELLRTRLYSLQYQKILYEQERALEKTKLQRELRKSAHEQPHQQPDSEHQRQQQTQHANYYSALIPLSPACQELTTAADGESFYLEYFPLDAYLYVPAQEGAGQGSLLLLDTLVSRYRETGSFRDVMTGGQPSIPDASMIALFKAKPVPEAHITARGKEKASKASAAANAAEQTSASYNLHTWLVLIQTQVDRHQAITEKSLTLVANFISNCKDTLSGSSMLEDEDIEPPKMLTAELDDQQLTILQTKAFQLLQALSGEASLNGIAKDDGKQKAPKHASRPDANHAAILNLPMPLTKELDTIGFNVEDYLLELSSGFTLEQIKEKVTLYCRANPKESTTIQSQKNQMMEKIRGNLEGAIACLGDALQQHLAPQIEAIHQSRRLLERGQTALSVLTKRQANPRTRPSSRLVPAATNVVEDVDSSSRWTSPSAAAAAAASSSNHHGANSASFRGTGTTPPSSHFHNNSSLQD